MILLSNIYQKAALRLNQKTQERKTKNNISISNIYYKCRKRSFNILNSQINTHTTHLLKVSVILWEKSTVLIRRLNKNRD